MGSNSTILDKIKETTYLSRFVGNYIKEAYRVSELPPDVRYVLDGYCEEHHKALKKIESYEQAIEQVQKICLDNSTTDTAKMNLVDRDKYLLGKNRLAGKILIVTSRAGKIDV